MVDENESLELIGTSIEFHAEGSQSCEEPIETEEFNLSQGVLIVNFEHHGLGEFKVSLKRVNEGFLRGFVETELFEGKGEEEAIDAWTMKKEWLQDLQPGVHTLEVAATGEWYCELFQPDLGQASTEFPVQYKGAYGSEVAGAFRTGPKPILVDARHDGGGEFKVKLLSLDGLHQEEVDNEGQVHLEDLPIGVMPGKEYLILVGASGNWDLEFKEGY